MEQVHKQHSRDPNFPIEIIQKIEDFLGTYRLGQTYYTPKL